MKTQKCMKRIQWVSVVLLILFCVLFTVDAAEIPVLKDLKSKAEQQRVSNLIKQAQAEGKLKWAGVVLRPEWSDKIVEEFKRYYGLPNLTSEYTYGNTIEIIRRIEELFRAKRNDHDIVWNVSWGWYQELMERGKILNYESPYYKEYTLSNQLGLSKPGYWVSDTYTYQPAYNPKVIEAMGIGNFQPNSWSDFFSPRFKGMISLGDPLRSEAYVAVVQGIEKVFKEQGLQKIAELKPALFTKSSQAITWLTSGEFPISLAMGAMHAELVLEAGVPVKMVYPKEGVVLMPWTPIILSDPPHPAVARLFIDFLRSERGALTVRDSGATVMFGRPGIPSKKPDLLPPLESIKVLDFNWDYEGSPEAIKKIREVVRRTGLSS